MKEESLKCICGCGNLKLLLCPENEAVYFEIESEEGDVVLNKGSIEYLSNLLNEFLTEVKNES